VTESFYGVAQLRPAHLKYEKSNIRNKKLPQYYQLAVCSANECKKEGTAVGNTSNFGVEIAVGGIANNNSKE
jgi:hypothetical protein